MSKRTSAGPHKSSFPKAVSGASSSAAGVSGAAEPHKSSFPKAVSGASSSAAAVSGAAEPHKSSFPKAVRGASSSAGVSGAAEHYKSSFPKAVRGASSSAAGVSGAAEPHKSSFLKAVSSASSSAGVSGAAEHYKSSFPKAVRGASSSAAGVSGAAEPHKSSFPKAVRGASSSAAAVSGAAYFGPAFDVYNREVFNNYNSSSSSASQARHTRFASSNNKKTSFHELLADLPNGSSSSWDNGVTDKFKTPQPSIAETVYEGAKNIGYALGLSKTQEDELALKNQEALDERLKAKRMPFDPDFGPSEFRALQGEINNAMKNLRGENERPKPKLTKATTPPIIGLSDKMFKSLPPDVKDYLRKQ